MDTLNGRARWFGLRCWLRLCPFRPDKDGAHCAFGCGRRCDLSLAQSYVYRDGRGRLCHYAPDNAFVHGQPVGEITSRDWNPVELVRCMTVAKEADWPMSGREPLMMGVGETLTCRMQDGSMRTYEIVVAGLAEDVMLRRLS